MNICLQYKSVQSNTRLYFPPNMQKGKFIGIYYVELTSPSSPPTLTVSAGHDTSLVNYWEAGVGVSTYKRSTVTSDDAAFIFAFEITGSQYAYPYISFIDDGGMNGSKNLADNASLTIIRVPSDTW